MMVDLIFFIFLILRVPQTCSQTGIWHTTKRNWHQLSKIRIITSIKSCSSSSLVVVVYYAFLHEIISNLDSLGDISNISENLSATL